MLRRSLSLLLLVTIAASSTGCYGAGRGSGNAGLAFAVLAGTALVVEASQRRPAREESDVHVVYLSSPSDPAPLPASRRDRVVNDADDLPGFDAKGARAALSSVDLSTCRAAGAPRGYGHAKVTFNPDGKASKVVVDTPDGLAGPAVQCIGQRLGFVNVAEYEGSYVTVGVTFFVP